MVRTIDATGLTYKQLNDRLFAAIDEGERAIRLTKVNGQRFIAAGCSAKDLTLEIDGTPGNDLACFANGPEIIVRGNVEDATANTMNSGRIIIHGDARDLTGHAMRGGKVFIKGEVGYRVGLHMKQFEANFPIIVVGGNADDFLGEYMAGGILIILGLNPGDDEALIGDWTGTGMHGGAMYVRGNVGQEKLGHGAKIIPFTEDDRERIRLILEEYGGCFGIKTEKLIRDHYTTIVPVSYRPFGQTYALKV